MTAIYEHASEPSRVEPVPTPVQSVAAEVEGVLKRKEARSVHHGRVMYRLGWAWGVLCGACLAAPLAALATAAHFGAF